MKVIKLLVLSLVFSSGLSHGKEVFRLRDFSISSKQESAYSSSLNLQVQYVIPASSIIPAQAGIQTKAKGSNMIGMIPKGLSHFFSENQNCKIEGTVTVKLEENFYRENNSVSFRGNPDSSFGLNPIPFSGNFYPNIEGWESFYGVLISGEELVKKDFHHNETDGEMAQYGYKMITESAEGAKEWGITVMGDTGDLYGSWQSAFSSGNLTGEKIVVKGVEGKTSYQVLSGVAFLMEPLGGGGGGSHLKMAGAFIFPDYDLESEKGVEVKTFHELYQALPRGSALYLMEPLGGGGGGSHLQAVGVLLSPDHYLESDEAPRGGLIEQPVQKSEHLSGSFQNGSSMALPAVQCTP